MKLMRAAAGVPRRLRDFRNLSLTSRAGVVVAVLGLTVWLTLDLVYQRIDKVSGRDVLAYEMQGTIGNSADLHFRGTLFLQGDKQIVITGTAAEEQWTKYGPIFDLLMKGLKINEVE